MATKCSLTRLFLSISGLKKPEFSAIMIIFTSKTVIFRFKWTELGSQMIGSNRKWPFITSFLTAYVSSFSYLLNHKSLWLKYLKNISKISQKFSKFPNQDFLKVSQKRTCLFEALTKAKNNLAHTITIILKGDLFYELFYLYYYIKDDFNYFCDC